MRIRTVRGTPYGLLRPLLVEQRREGRFFGGMRDLEPSVVLRGRSGTVCSVNFLTETVLVSGHAGLGKKEAPGSVMMWEIPSGRRLSSTVLNAGTVNTVRISDTRLMSQDRFGMLQVWDVAASGSELIEAARIATGCNTMCRCAPCPGGAGSEEEGSSFVAMPQACDGVDTGVSSELDVWDLRANKVSVQTGIGDDGNKHGMCMSLTLTGVPGEPGALLVRGCEDGSVGIFDLTAGRWRSNLILHKEAVLSVAMMAKNRRGLSGSADKTVAAFSVDVSNSDSEDGICQLQAMIDVGEKGVADIAVRSDEKIFGVASWDHRTRIYSMKKLEPLAILKYHKESTNALAFSPDNATMASASKDSTVAIWTVYPRSKPK